MRTVYAAACLLTTTSAIKTEYGVVADVDNSLNFKSAQKLVNEKQVIFVDGSERQTVNGKELAILFDPEDGASTATVRMKIAGSDGQGEELSGFERPTVQYNNVRVSLSEQKKLSDFSAAYVKFQNLGQNALPLEMTIQMPASSRMVNGNNEPREPTTTVASVVVPGGRNPNPA